jgi:general stress protein 26
MKLHVNMCIKLERHEENNNNNNNWKDTKILKDIEKNKEICVSFNILGSIKTFWNIICKVFIFFKF